MTLCTQCGKKPSTVWSTICLDCWNSHQQWSSGIMPPPQHTTALTDQQIEDEVAATVNGWDRERQLIAYKMLFAQGLRIGSGLDFELNELRRKRAKA